MTVQTVSLSDATNPRLSFYNLSRNSSNFFHFFYRQLNSLADPITVYKNVEEMQLLHQYHLNTFNAMSILCERPDTEFFHTIPHLHDAVHSFAANKVLSKLTLFGTLFAKYDVADKFGLAMVHRHFDISKDEILVETINERKSVSVTSPWIINGKSNISDVSMGVQ